MDRSGTRIALALVFAALAIRVAFVLATPGYTLVHDALDYQRHAVSIASGHGFALSYGRPTAFRPPAYPIFLAAVYVVTGPDVEWGRIANAFVGTGIVALIGVIAFQLWGRRIALIALALGAVYVPLILVGQSIMSEPLFVLCLLGAIACVLHSKRWPWVVAAGVLMGLAILGRANAIVLLAPLAAAVWRGWRAPLVLCVVAGLTVAPWTIRNYETFHAFVPVSTQFGSALAGTYNSEAKADKKNPASWRTLKRVDDYRPIFNRVRSTPEPVLEKELRKASIEFIKAHPGYVLTVAWWTSRRMLDLAGMDWSIHTAATISATRGWAIAGVICFWVFALLALVGAFTREARAAPWWLWAVPLLMYLSVVFLVVETPRYRTAIDPFIVLLAALCVSRAAPARTRS
ncbi:ArnT family glycosyltransferase [Solirubrobacter soli]|uniref:ArnT family glycosyltransferase n=1 Tax=Solirubrobacter soli TaxID=363832 RepID=UPI0004272CB2|nr:glycosyltransferase family 39 protein [Solirubrobacter soli]